MSTIFFYFIQIDLAGLNRFVARIFFLEIVLLNTHLKIDEVTVFWVGTDYNLLLICHNLQSKCFEG